MLLGGGISISIMMPLEGWQTSLSVTSFSIFFLKFWDRRGTTLIAPSATLQKESWEGIHTSVPLEFSHEMAVFPGTIDIPQGPEKDVSISTQVQVFSLKVIVWTMSRSVYTFTYFSICMAISRALNGCGPVSSERSITICPLPFCWYFLSGIQLIFLDDYCPYPYE